MKKKEFDHYHQYHSREKRLLNRSSVLFNDEGKLIGAIMNIETIDDVLSRFYCYLFFFI